MPAFLARALPHLPSSILVEKPTVVHMLGVSYQSLRGVSVRYKTLKKHTVYFFDHVQIQVW